MWGHYRKQRTRGEAHGEEQRDNGSDVTHEEEEAREVNAWDRGFEGVGAGGENELVVALYCRGAGLQVLHGDGLGRAVNARHFMLRLDQDVEALLERLLCGMRETTRSFGRYFVHRKRVYSGQRAALGRYQTPKSKFT